MGGRRFGWTVVLWWTCAVSLANADDPPLAPQPVKQRIITLAPNAAEIICALGVCDQVIAVSKFCVHPSELQDRPRVGGLFDPDIEKIIALRPDLIVLRGKCESVERLSTDRKIDIYFDKTERLSDVEATILELGRVLHRKEPAAKLAESFRSRLAAVRRRVADQPRPRVLLTISRRPDRIANLLTTGKGTFLDEMIEIAGGVNVFGDLDMPYPQIAPEAIVTHRPDVIIELMPELEATPVLLEQVLGVWRELSPVPAVRDGRIHLMTEDNALIPSPRYVAIIEKVSQILHPELDRGD